MFWSMKRMVAITTKEGTGRITPERSGVRYFPFSPTNRYGGLSENLRSNQHWLATHSTGWHTTKLVGIAYLTV